MKITQSQKTATQLAIKKIAYYTAVQCKGEKRQAAIKHCQELGVDHNAPTFEQSSTSEA
jgi:hypothetical protein